MALCTQSARNLFQVLGVSESFVVDDQQLAQRFKQLQHRWHPDRFHNSPPDQQNHARHMSATLNVAYATLRQPHARARHLLRLRASDDAQRQQASHLEGVSLEPTFLGWVMLFREQIADAGADTSTLKALSSQLSERLADCLRRLEAAFEHNRLEEAARYTAELQYYHRMERALHEAS